MIRDGKRGVRGRDREERDREERDTHHTNYGTHGNAVVAPAASAAPLIEENERLKSIIKEMRADVEAMHRHSDSLTR